MKKRLAFRWLCSLLCLFVMLLLVGCVSYHPAPLTGPVALHALSPPDMAQVRLRAAEIEHPLLRPIPFDERDGLSPGEAAILAVIANPALRAVRDRKEVAAAQLLQAGILPNPQFSYSFETPTGGDTNGKVNAFDLGLDWEIRSLVIRNARTDAARRYGDSVDLGVAWQEWQAAEAAKRRVYRLVIAQKRYALGKRMESMTRDSYDLTLRAVTLGEKTATDLSGAKISVQQARNDVTRAWAAMEQERLELNRALGLPPGGAVRLEQDIRLPFLHRIPPSEEFIKGIQKRRLDLLALRQGYESQEAKVRAAIRAQFPKISIGLSGGRDTDTLQYVGLGVTMDLPLFDRSQGRIAVERATRKQLFDEYTARLFEARAQITRLVRALRAVQEEIANLSGSLPAIRQQAESYRKATDKGLLTAWNYYQAMDRLRAIELERVDLEQRLADLGIALEIASGRYSLFSGGCGAKTSEKVLGTEGSR